MIGNWDASSALTTKPAKTGTVLPATCSTGEAFFNTAATAGQNFYLCKPDNTWTQVTTGGSPVDITTSCGVTGGPITGTGALSGSISLDPETGASAFAIPTTDCATVIYRNNAAAVSDTIAGAGIGGSFPSGWFAWYQCVGAGGCTITPATSTINGASSIALPSGTSVMIQSNGSNYTAVGNVKTIPSASSATPAMDGTGAAGSSASFARADHVHPTDTSRQATITGAPSTWPSTFVPSAHASTHAAAGSDPVSLSASQIGSGYPYTSLTGAPSIPSASSATPAMDGTAAAGSSASFSRADHVHPTDISRQATITGAPSTWPSFGGAALLSVGTTAGTVAAGNDSRFSGISPTSNALVFNGSTTLLADGSIVSWSCGTGSGAQCTATWTVPSGLNWVTVQEWGAGGGGSGSTAGSASGSAGGGGGYWQGVCPVTAGGTATVKVGVGGAASASNAGAGAGGNSSFGTCAAVIGGDGGGTSNGPFGGRLYGSDKSGWYAYSGLVGPGNSNCSTNTGGTGGNAMRFDMGGCGGYIQSSSGSAGGPGGSAPDGGGGGGSGGYNNAAGGAGGVSAVGNTIYSNGGNGGNGGGWTSGGGQIACSAGLAPGGGGGSAGAQTGGGSNQTGCGGARGEVRVFYIN